MLQGRPKVVQDGVATYFQPPLQGTDRSFKTNPGLVLGYVQPPLGG